MNSSVIFLPTLAAETVSLGAARSAGAEAGVGH